MTKSLFNIRRSVVIAALSMVLATAAHSAPVGDVKGLLATESARFAAMVAGDIPAIEASLADELVYVHSSSVVQGKSEIVRDIENGKAAYRRIDIQEQAPAVYGKVGVINGVARFTTAGGGRETSFLLRYTDVYLRRGGRWQMVAWHCTRMPMDDPAKPKG